MEPRDKKVICNICLREITEERMKKSSILERWLLNLAKTHYVTDSKDNFDVCGNCIKSFKMWVEERRF